MYPLIDLLRAAAALLVVVYHVIVVGHWGSFPGTDPWRIFMAGWIGVDFFLVISGFVITLSALRGFAQDASNYRWPFFKHRLARIVPLYLLTCIVFLLVVERTFLSLGWGIQLQHYVTHLLFVHNLFAETHGSINGPTWSIALEMQFYLAMILAIPWLSRQRWITVMVLLFVLAWLYRYLMTLVLAPRVAPPIMQMIYTSQFPGTLDQFACGIVLALGLTRRPLWLEARLQLSWKNFALWAGLAALLLTTAMVLFWPRSAYWYFIPMIVFWRSLLSVGFACAVAAAITCPKPHWWVLQPLLYLGEISYGIYLWHMLVLVLFMRWFHLQGGELLIAVLGVTVVLAAASWHGFERPIMNWARGRKSSA